MENWIESYCTNKQTLNPLFFICGPIGLKMKTVPVIRMMAFDDSSIFTEDFIIKEALRPHVSELSDARVELHFQGELFQFKLHAGKNILEEALDAGIELPYSCRSGICTTCSAHCSTGKAVMYAQDGISDTCQTNGDVLTCVAYPLTPFIEIKI
jgi:ring-1,2-phenylacetyl-CoA epoxidase subunit PaaE